MKIILLQCIVLTGGSAQSPGAIDLAENIFKIPVRLGTPQGVTGLTEVINNPVYATGVGLLILGKQHLYGGHVEVRADNSIKDLWGKMKSWFQGNF